jgi:hypothetical protein
MSSFSELCQFFDQFLDRPKTHENDPLPEFMLARIPGEKSSPRLPSSKAMISNGGNKPEMSDLCLRAH